MKVTLFVVISLLSLFFLIVIFRKLKIELTPKNVLLSYIVGASGVYLNTFHLHWNWNFNVYLGFGLSSIAVILLSKLRGK